MKNSNYAKPLLAVVALSLIVSLFFNLREVLLAQASNRTLKSQLTNYVGEQVYLAACKTQKGVLKEVNADNIVVEEGLGQGQTQTYVVPFEAIKVIFLSPKPNHPVISLGL